ncbi:P-II family nitrogen regulator [Lachnospiraceae bacterium 54-53]
MKEIITIIRPKKVNATKEALEQLGIPGMTAIPVLGRGKQKGIAGEVNIEYRPGILDGSKNGGMKYIPKRYLSIAVQDEEVDAVLDVIIKVNKTGQFGDGKIFVCPIEDVVRIRTDEQGSTAIS